MHVGAADVLSRSPPVNVQLFSGLSHGFMTDRFAGQALLETDQRTGAATTGCCYTRTDAATREPSPTTALTPRVEFCRQGVFAMRFGLQTSDPFRRKRSQRLRAHTK